MICIKNWREFQHYKKRRPPWIKLHRTLIDDVNFMRLQPASRALAPCIWLLASEFDDGNLDMTIDDIAWRLRLTIKEVRDAVSELESIGYIECKHDASGVLAQCKQGATLETEGEGESEAEAKEDLIKESKITNEKAEDIYNAYPRKKGKLDAIKAIKKALKKRPFDLLLIDVMKFAKSVEGKDPQYIPFPATWFNQGRWDDQPDPITPQKSTRSTGASLIKPEDEEQYIPPF